MGPEGRSGILSRECPAVDLSCLLFVQELQQDLVLTQTRCDEGIHPGERMLICTCFKVDFKITLGFPMEF